MSIIRQNFHIDTESVINEHLNLELKASYAYLNLGYFFDRADIALEGLKKYFLKMSDRKLEKAKLIMEYQNKRGGKVVWKNISKSDISDVIVGIDAMKYSLELEKIVNQSLINLHDVASRTHDPHFSEFVEEEFMTEQVELLKTLGDYVTNFERVGRGLGEYLFDHELGEKSYPN